MKLKKSLGRVNARRKSALARLKQNLKDGKEYHEQILKIPETHKNFSVQKIVDGEREISRVINEIATLEKRIISDESAKTQKNKKYRGVR